MKTFEERYTAWIDGQLTGDALTAFEQELARRAEAGDAESDKTQALQLRSLLKEHLSAPTLTNAEFFSHQMRERIDAEIDKAARRREAASRPAWRFPAFAWPFARVAGAGLACLFVAGALYYGTMPPRQDNNQKVAVTNLAVPTPSVDTTNVAKNDPVTPLVQAPDQRTQNDGKFANLTEPTPAPIDLNEDIRVVQPNPNSTTSATAFPFEKANVFWVNNPPYLPSVNGANPSPTPAPNTEAAPAASAAPSAAP